MGRVRQQHPQGDNDEGKNKEGRIDYGKLRNDQLFNLLCTRDPDKPFLPVSRYSRQTVLAMLKITEAEE